MVLAHVGQGLQNQIPLAQIVVDRDATVRRCWGRNHTLLWRAQVVLEVDPITQARIAGEQRASAGDEQNERIGANEYLGLARPLGDLLENRHSLLSHLLNVLA